MEPVAVIQFIVGLAVLIIGGEFLVRGSVRLAGALGISPLVIGLTVVAFGTSAPELAVGVQASAAGQGDLALGNVVGSNILNVLLILGLSAVIAPLTVSRQLVRIDVPIMIVVSIVVWLMASAGVIGRLDGALLFAGIIVYVVFSIWFSRKQERNTAAGDPAAPAAELQPSKRLLSVVFILGGLVCLIAGSNWLVGAAESFAVALGIDDVIIGLTVVAIGTSLPEIVTSVMAGIRGQRDIAVGNVVGSNLFNMLAVLGAAALVAPDGIPVPPTVLSFDLPVMVATMVACLPVFFNGMRISRWEGAVFLGYYVAYTAYLILAATRHAALDVFSAVMLVFVIPLTLLTLAVVTVQYALRYRRVHKA